MKPLTPFLLALLAVVLVSQFAGIGAVSATGSYDYKVSSSQVLNSAGSSVYTGSSFTTALNWAVGHANTVTYVPAGTYTLTANVYFAAGTTLFGDGNATVFTSSSVCSLDVIDVSNVAMSSFQFTGSVRVVVWADSGQTISNFDFANVNGNAVNSAPAYAFWVYSGSNAIIDGITYTDCSVRSSGTYGWCMNGAGSGMGPYNNLIENVQWTGCQAIGCGQVTHCNDWVPGFDLAEMTNVRNFVLTNCEADYSEEAGFHFENFPSISGIQFINCVASYNGQKPSNYHNDDGTTGPEFGTGFFFDTAQEQYIAFETCSGVGNAKGLSIIDRAATTLNTVSGPIQSSIIPRTSGTTDDNLGGNDAVVLDSFSNLTGANFTNTEWLVLHWYYPAMVVGLVVILLAAYSRHFLIMLLGVALIVFAYLYMTSGGVLVGFLTGTGLNL